MIPSATGGCYSAWGPDADRRSKPTLFLDMAGSNRRACSQSEVDDAELRGVRDSIGSAGGVELVEKRTDMKLDGMN